MAKAELEAFVAKHNITLNAVFVPFSQSRNRDTKYRSLNWSVVMQANGRVIYSGDYSAGEAHCPSYKNSQISPRTFEVNKRIEAECETGYRHKGFFDGWRTNERIKPDILSVLYCAISDADAVDYGSFEDWAENLGWDSDSRKAYECYQTCLQTGLKLRAALGDEGFRELQQAAQDY